MVYCHHQVWWSTVGSRYLCYLCPEALSAPASVNRVMIVLISGGSQHVGHAVEVRSGDTFPELPYPGTGINDLYLGAGCRHCCASNGSQLSQISGAVTTIGWWSTRLLTRTPPTRIRPRTRRTTTRLCLLPTTFRALQGRGSPQPWGRARICHICRRHRDRPTTLRPT